MKNLITILLLFFGVRSAVGADPVNPDAPIYQLDWGIMPPGNRWFGGAWSEREQLTAKTPKERRLEIELENMAITAAKGRKLMSQGISALVLGVILLFFLKQYSLQGIGLGVAMYGIWRFASGLIEIKLAENWQIATGALFVGIIIVLAGAMLWTRGVNIGTLKALIKRKGSK